MPQRPILFLLLNRKVKNKGERRPHPPPNSHQMSANKAPALLLLKRQERGNFTRVGTCRMGLQSSEGETRAGKKSPWCSTVIPTTAGWQRGAGSAPLQLLCAARHRNHSVPQLNPPCPPGPRSQPLQEQGKVLGAPL